MALDITNIKTQLQARIDALTTSSTVEDVLLVSKTVNELVGDGVDLTNLRAQLQTKIDALTGASELKDVLLVSKTVEAAATPMAQSTLIATADNQILAIEAEGAAQVGAVEAAGTTQVSAVESAGATQAAVIQDEGTTQISLVNSAGATQVAAIQAEGAGYARTNTAQTWAAKQTFSAGINESWSALSGTTPAITAGNHTWTLTGNSTPTDGLADGDSCTLMINDGSAYTITWSNVVDVWMNGGSAPTLATSGYTGVVLWKVGSTVYAMEVPQ